MGPSFARLPDPTEYRWKVVISPPNRKVQSGHSKAPTVAPMSPPQPVHGFRLQSRTLPPNEDEHSPITCWSKFQHRRPLCRHQLYKLQQAFSRLSRVLSGIVNEAVTSCNVRLEWLCEQGTEKSSSRRRHFSGLKNFKH